jgi:hypothetical protein
LPDASTPNDEARGGIPLIEIHPQLGGSNAAGLKLEPFSWELLKSRGVEVLFPRHPARAIARVGS